MPVLTGRLVFPDQGSQLVYSRASLVGVMGEPLLSTAHRTIRIYTDDSLLTLADIRTYPGGAPIAGSVLTVTAGSTLPLFLGPADGSDVLFDEFGNAVAARTADILNVFDAAISLNATNLSDEIGDRLAGDDAEASIRASADMAEAATRSAAVAAEAATRAADDTAEATARANADTAETTSRAAGDLAEATQRAAGDSINAAALAAHLADTSDAHDASAISFTASGFTATEVQAALEELFADIAINADPRRYYPERYGNVNTGFSAAFNAASSAAAATGGIVTLGHREYRASGTGGAPCLNLFDDVSLEGAGMGATVIRAVDGLPVGTRLLDCQSKSNVTISDVTLDGNYANISHEVNKQRHCVFARGAQQFLAERVECRNQDGDGIYLGHDANAGGLVGKNNTVRSCYLHDLHRIGVTVGSGADEVLIDGNVIVNCDQNVIDIEPAPDRPKNVTICNNYFGLFGQAGMFIEDVDGANVYGNSGDGLVVLLRTTGVDFHDNSFDSTITGTAPLLIEYSNANLQVHDNRLTMSNTSGTVNGGPYAIAVIRVSTEDQRPINVDIHDNTIILNAVGVGAIQGDPRSIKFNDNTIEGQHTGAIGGAFRPVDDIHTFEVVGNTLRNLGRKNMTPEGVGFVLDGANTGIFRQAVIGLNVFEDDTDTVLPSTDTPGFAGGYNWGADNGRNGWTAASDLVRLPDTYRQVAIPEFFATVGGPFIPARRTTGGQAGAQALIGRYAPETTITAAREAKYDDEVNGGHFYKQTATTAAGWFLERERPTRIASSTAAAYALALADQGRTVYLDISTGVLTLNPNAVTAFPAGAKFEVVQFGTTQVTVTPGAGVTVNSAVGAKTRARHSRIYLEYLGGDVWYLWGDATP